MEHQRVVILLTFFLLFSFGADFKAVTIDLKNGKTVLLKPDFSWEYYVPPIIVKPIVVRFKDLAFGSSTADFYALYKNKIKTIKEWPEEGVLYFDDTFANEQATLFYYFKKNKFYHAEIVFKINSDKNDVYLNKFDSVKKIISTSYGNPKTDFKMFNEWLIGDDYTIRLLLTNQKNKVYLGAIYNCNTCFKETLPPTENNSITVTENDTKPKASPKSVETKVIDAPKKPNIDDIKNLIKDLDE